MKEQELQDKLKNLEERVEYLEQELRLYEHYDSIRRGQDDD